MRTFTMKIAILPILFLLSVTGLAQSSTWDVHPLNTTPCPEWIYPAPGCGGCGSCRMALDTDESLMDGGLLHWSEDLVMCPHPIDTLGNNVVVIAGYPMDAYPGTFLRGRVDFHEAVQLDTLELTCASSNGGPDSVDLAIQFNTMELSQTITIFRTGLTNALTTYAVSDLGCAPMIGGSGYMNIYVRAHGGTQAFLFKGLHLVGSHCSMVSVAEVQDGHVTVLPWNDGVNITLQQAAPVSICDALGRITYSAKATAGTTFVPLNDGLNIVRAGDTVRKIVR